MGAESYKKPIGRRPTGLRKRVVNINMPHETDERLTAFSKNSSRSKSEVASQAIAEYLDRNED